MDKSIIFTCFQLKKYVEVLRNEEKVDLIISDYKNIKKPINTLEIGTGSGAISIALAKNLDNFHIETLEISRKAINLSMINIVQNAVADKVDVKKVNYLKTKIEKKYDIIFSNPPYIDSKDSNVSKWSKKNQPIRSLYVKHKGVDFYNKIFNDAKNILNPGGKVYLEIGYNQKEVLEPIIPSYFKNYKFHKDLNKKFRYLVLEI